MAVVSAGPYASLHLASTDNHASTPSLKIFTGRMPFLSPNQQHQSTHTHTRLTALCQGLPRWAGTRQVKPIWILLEQEIVSGSGISWAICKSALCSRQITMPAPHSLLSFLQAGCSSCHPTNSVKALKAKAMKANTSVYHWQNITFSQSDAET